MPPVPEAAVRPALAPLSPRWVPRRPGDGEGEGVDSQPAGGPAGRSPEDAVSALVRELSLPEPICRLLVLRGHADPDSARRFLRPRLDQLHDPFLLTGMREAVGRIERALESRERILVHGDYDVDGVCSAVLLTRVLRKLGGDVVPFVPHRVTDGYDLGAAGIRRASEVGATLIVTGPSSL